MWRPWETCIEEGMEVGNENSSSSEIEQDNGADPMDSGKFKNLFSDYRWNVFALK